MLNYIRDYGPGLGGLVITLIISSGGLWLLFKSAIAQVMKKDLNQINQQITEIQSVQKSLINELQIVKNQLGVVKENVRHHEKYIDQLKSIRKSL